MADKLATNAASPIQKLIKEQDALIADLTKQLRAAQIKRSELMQIAKGQALAAKHGI